MTIRLIIILLPHSPSVEGGAPPREGVHPVPQGFLSFFKAWRLPDEGESKQYVDSSCCLPALPDWLKDCSQSEARIGPANADRPSSNFRHSPVGTAATSRRETEPRPPKRFTFKRMGTFTSNPPGSYHDRLVIA